MKERWNNWHPFKKKEPASESSLVIPNPQVREKIEEITSKNMTDMVDGKYDDDTEDVEEKPAIETAENYEMFKKYIDSLVKEGYEKGIPSLPTVSSAEMKADVEDYKGAFGCLEQAQEYYVNRFAAIAAAEEKARLDAERRQTELEDTSIDSFVDGPRRDEKPVQPIETPEQEAARKKAEEKAEDDRHLVAVAVNGEPDHVVYRSDKRSFADAAITVLKKQKINAKLKIDPNYHDSFTVMVPEELAKDKRFKPIEKELNKKTGKMHGLEEEGT
jgi:hypothetical protein